MKKNVHPTALSSEEVKAKTLEIVEMMHDACLIMDRNLNYLYVNKEALKISNKKKQEMIGHNIIDVFPGAEHTLMYKLLQKAVKSNKHTHFEEYSVTIKKWLAVRVFPTTDTVTVYISDISKRKIIEQALQQSEERYKAFISQASEAIWRFELDVPLPTNLSIDAQIEHCYKHAYLAESNVALAKMYGISNPKNLVGMRLAELLPRNQHNLAYLKAFIQSNYRLENAESHEFDAQGNQKYFLNNLVAVIENGTVIRAWGTQRDTTAQKQAESEIQAVLSSLTSHIAVLNQKGEITAVNAAWNAFAKENGVTQVSNVGIGENYLTVLKKSKDDKDSQIILKGIKSVLSGKLPMFTFEYPCHSPTQNRWFMLQVAPLLHGKGGVVISHTNITQRKLLETQKDEFMSIASHELKTPLTSLKAYAQVLIKQLNKKQDTASSAILTKMDSQLDKLTDLISDLLDVTKIEAGKLQLSISTFNFNDLVEETVESMQLTTDTKIQLNSTKQPIEVTADKDRISQVITNFISNAIKYSPNSKKIIVAFKVSANDVVLSVQDFGIGIAPKMKAHVFERFYRATGLDSSSFPGLGLGLYISAEIIHRHKGSIWVESTKDKGSTFYFKLPFYHSL